MKVQHDILYDVNSNICPICHHLQDILNQNVHVYDIDLDIEVNCKYENQELMNFYLMTIVMFAVDFHYLWDIAIKQERPA